MTLATVKVPARIADAVDTYFQTRNFSLTHGAKFNKELVLRKIQEAAIKCKYLSVEGTTGNFVFKGKASTLTVNADTFPNGIRASL